MTYPMRVRQIRVFRRGHKPRRAYQAVYHLTGQIAGTYPTLRMAMHRAADLAGWSGYTPPKEDRR